MKLLKTKVVTYHTNLYSSQSPVLLQVVTYHTNLYSSQSALQSVIAKLDDGHDKLVDAVESLVEAPPPLKDCTKLTVKGPVNLAKGVCTTGIEIATNTGNSLVTVPAV